MNGSRYSWILPLAMLVCCGCQPLAPGTSQQLVRSGPTDDMVDARDDDSFSGRFKTGATQLTEAATKPLDPTYWQQRQQEKAIAKKREQQQQAAAAKRRKPAQKSAFMAWLFPEPKQPRTLSEWLSQERPES